MLAEQCEQGGGEEGDRSGSESEGDTHVLELKGGGGGNIRCRLIDYAFHWYSEYQ